MTSTYVLYSEQTADFMRNGAIVTIDTEFLDAFAFLHGQRNVIPCGAKFRVKILISSTLAIFHLKIDNDKMNKKNHNWLHLTFLSNKFNK